jgi:hypothetical protein
MDSLEKISDDGQFVSIYGFPARNMYDLQRFFLENTHDFCSAYELLKGRMKKYNSCESVVRQLNAYRFMVPKNPIVSDPEGTGEQIIINDLNKECFDDLKKRVLCLSAHKSNSGTISLSENTGLAKKIYERWKSEGEKYSTLVLPEEVYELSENPFALPETRERIVTGLFLNNLDVAKEYVDSRCEMYGLTDKTLLFPYITEIFSGIKLMEVESTRAFSSIVCAADLEKDECSLLVISKKLAREFAQTNIKN